MAELSRQLSIFEAPELINEDSALISFSLEKRLYFKKILTEYNTEAKEAAIGLSDMFEGNPLNREQISTPIKTSEKYEQRIDEIRTNNDRIAQAIEARGNEMRGEIALSNQIRQKAIEMGMQKYYPKLTVQIILDEQLKLSQQMAKEVSIEETMQIMIYAAQVGLNR